jgi:hypothetical protein
LNIVFQVVPNDSQDFVHVHCDCPLSFLILLIWVFSLLIFVRVARDSSILFTFSKNQLFVSLILVWCFCSPFCWSQLIFYFPLLLLVLGLGCFCFCMSLRCSTRSFTLHHSMVFNMCFHGYKHSFVVSYRFWQILIKFQELFISSFISSLPHWSWHMFFSFHVFEYFLYFFFLVLLLFCCGNTISRGLFQFSYIF